MSEFTWDKENKIVDYYIDPKFSFLDPQTEKEKSKWKKNRLEAYFNSTTFLFRSIIKGDFEHDGFKLYRTNKETDAYKSYLIKILPVQTKGELVEEDDSTNNTFLSFEEYLAVDYKNQYTHSDKIGWIKLLQEKVQLDKFGYPVDRTNFIAGGYFRNSGMADMLPKYFGIQDIIEQITISNDK